MRKIKLTQRKYALVDNSDYDWLSQWKWHAVRERYTFYAMRREGGSRVLMHRVILGLKKGRTNAKLVPDHRNRNGLNNQRYNLRIVTKSVNALNSRLRVDSSSGIKGVGWCKINKKWRSFTRIGRKFIHVGYYYSIRKAHLGKLKKEKALRQLT